MEGERKKKEKAGNEKGRKFFFFQERKNACTQFYVPCPQTRRENLQGQEQKLPKYICL